MFQRTSRDALVLVLLAAGLLCSGMAGAQALRDANDSLALRAFDLGDRRPQADSAPIAEMQSRISNDTDAAWREFAAGQSVSWIAYVDQRTARVDYAEGGNLAWIPGRGNRLIAPAGQRVDLAMLERLARNQLGSVADMLGVDPNALRLNPGRSGQPSDFLWFVDFDVFLGEHRIEGARVVFAVNSGNLVSFGSENLPSPGTVAPALRVARDAAWTTLFRYVDGLQPGDQVLDNGSYKLIPVALADASFAEGYEPGRGRGVIGVWEFLFRRAGIVGTWRGRVDATSGELVEFVDVNDYGSATGGAYRSDRPATEVVLPLPFTNVASGVYTNSAGVFSGTTGTTTLQGQYVRITDSCGSISKAADASGLIALGSGSGTDCTTPGSGGAGNTHASRTQFYMVNRAKEIGRGWLPSNSWLSGALTVNVNLNQTCNAYWNGSSINFFRSGGGCANTGELPGVSLHEWGHGLDSNDGNGSSSDNGTGETYGDFSAALFTHNSCIGNGFLGTSNCGGYGNACTSCSGVRDIDWAKHTANTPSTVSNFTQPRCPTSSSYRGPCGREGHCESYVSSEALWDFVNRDLPNPGSGAAWTVADRLWYLSRSTATKAFNCTASGTWTANGCFTGSYFRAMRTVDDDNGNLTDGTPHGGALGAAFNRHGIACTTDTGWNTTFAAVTPPAAPVLAASGGANSAALSWSGSSGVYDVYRNEAGCNAGFTKVANDVATASYNDSAVANGFTYYYQVVAQPSGSEAAGSVPSNCASVTPSGGSCTPPAAPTGVAASSSSQTAATVTWNASSGATSYTVSRSTTSGGPYTAVGTSATTSFADSGLTCNTTYYYVVSASNGSCSSGNSSQASVTTQACTGGGTATFDATLQAPKCATVGNSCDTGASLVLGRASLGPEPNQPNTINDSCADGTSGTFHSDESNDRLKVYTVDGTDFAPGKQVRVEATVWAYSTFSSDYLDLYYAPNATSPVWTLIGTQSPTAAGAQVLSATYTLPTGGSLQAVRAAFRYTGSAGSCVSGSYNDRDDLVFAVGGGGGDTTPPTTAITAPANGATVSGTVSVTASASDNVGVTQVQFYIDGVLASTDTTSPYSYSWNTTAVANGSHTIYSRASDAAGNTGTSSTVTVTVSNTAGCTNTADVEPNNSRTAPQVISGNCNQIAGTFANETTTSDYFRLSLPAGATVTALLNGLTVDYDLYIYNSVSGSAVAQSTNGGTTPDQASWTNSGGSAINVYVRVYRYSSTRTTYALRVSY